MCRQIKLVGESLVYGQAMGRVCQDPTIDVLCRRLSDPELLVVILTQYQPCLAGMLGQGVAGLVITYRNGDDDLLVSAARRLRLPVVYAAAAGTLPNGARVEISGAELFVLGEGIRGRRAQLE